MILLYGYYQGKLFFSSKSQQSPYFANIESQIMDKLSCKYIKGYYFICALIINNKVGLILLNYFIDNKNPLNNKFDYYSTFYLSCSGISEIALYDTTKDIIKIIYLNNIDKIECYFFNINIIYRMKLEISQINLMHINIQIPNYFSENNCYFSEFNNELLFCCGLKDCIFCFRIDKSTLKLIGQFKLKIPGDISYLTIKSNNDFITFFYMNNNENGAGIFEYYLYLPKCQNKRYVILNSINWNKSEKDKERLSNLFKIEANNYYFELINLHNEYGYFTLDNIKIEENQQISILDKNFFLILL